MIVAAGTLLTPRDVHAAGADGARFDVSPGLTDRLLDATEDAGLPMLPGVATQARRGMHSNAASTC